jgi:adenosylcobyric acid synthase
MIKSMKNSVRPVMLQGTSSHVGKSVLTAALCRILFRRGFRVAPFKAQNMALNSFVTKDGAEIGRAQAFQAEAAGIEPASDLNPILLKPTEDSTSQVIINGHVYGVMSARDYHTFKAEARRYVLESYRRLAEEYDVIIIEGAGSPAEVNLRANDIANMGVAELVDSPVLLVGDIDRGGVFASIVGTMELLEGSERERVKGFIINKFRGDIGLLEPGLEFLTERTGRPTLGVVPYLKDINLPDEDGVALEGRDRFFNGDGEQVEIRVVKLPRISNFTDFDPLASLPGVSVRFVETPGGLTGADLVIIPGSKNTLGDLKWLIERGFAGAIRRLSTIGVMVVGICGGLQMLGQSINDPKGVESGLVESKGLGLLDSVTTLMDKKSTFQVEAEASFGGVIESVEGYEIHMGETLSAERPFSTIRKRNGMPVDVRDGAISANGLVWGTYIHGIFDNDPFRRTILDGLREKKGMAPEACLVNYNEMKSAAIEGLADLVEESLDMDGLYKIMGLAEGEFA